MSDDKQTEERAAFEAWYAENMSSSWSLHELAMNSYMAGAALSSAPAREQWQPIETAPKDGRKLLLWWAGMSRVGRCAGVGAARDGGDWWQVPSLECAPTGRPTHWMPLPAAPGATAEPAPAREPMTEGQQVCDVAQPVCPDCGGAGIDGDVDDRGKTIDVPCHCQKQTAALGLTDEQRVDWLCEAAEFTCGQWQVVIESDSDSFIDAVDEMAARHHGICKE